MCRDWASPTIDSRYRISHTKRTFPIASGLIIASPTWLVGGRADSLRAIVRVIDIHCSSLFPAAANGPDVASFCTCEEVKSAIQHKALASEPRPPREAGLACGSIVNSLILTMAGRAGLRHQARLRPA